MASSRERTLLLWLCNLFLSDGFKFSSIMREWERFEGKLWEIMINRWLELFLRKKLSNCENGRKFHPNEFWILIHLILIQQFVVQNFKSSNLCTRAFFTFYKFHFASKISHTKRWRIKLIKFWKTLFISSSNNNQREKFETTDDI